MTFDLGVQSGSGDGGGEHAEAKERRHRDLEREEQEAEERWRVAKLRAAAARGERLTRADLVSVHADDICNDLKKWKPLLKSGGLAKVFGDLLSLISAISVTNRLARDALEDRLAVLESSAAVDKLEARVAQLEAAASWKALIRTPSRPISRVAARTKPGKATSRVQVRMKRQ